MSLEHHVAPFIRGLALTIVVAAGLAAIVGSGGGGSAPDCSFFSNACEPDLTPPPTAPAASIDAIRVTVRAGTGATFVARSMGIDQPRFQWLRSADDGRTYVDIVGATDATYALAVTQFADDGAMFRVDVRGNGSNTVLTSSSAVTLLVSSMPAVGFSDGEFEPAVWSASALADPAQNGPTHSEQRSATGGLPDAYRHMVHTMTAGPSTLRVFNANATAVYDPKVLGAIHAIDYSEDCNRVTATSSSITVLSFAMIEQSGRHYSSTGGRGCLALWIGNFSRLPSLRAADFEQVDGPPCGSGESCPDFSAAGAPLHFGFERRVSLVAGALPGLIEHGIDNWTVQVWRP
jgi:hypothetical protein